MKDLFNQQSDALTSEHLVNVVSSVGISIIKIIFAIIFISLVKNIIERIIVNYYSNTKRFRNNSGRKNTLENLSLNILKIVYYFFLAYTILSLLGIPVGTLLASAGIIGLAISFGAKDLIADFANGFFILLENQYDVGDEVNFDGIVEGQVIEVSLRTTTIRSYDGTTNYLPNGEIKLVSNFSQNEYRISYTFLMYPETNTNKLGQVLEDAFDRAKEKDDRVARFQNLGVMRDDQGRLVFEVRIWVYDHQDEVDIHGEYYQYFYEELAKAGIDLPDGDVTDISLDEE